MVASNLPRRFREVFRRISNQSAPVFENAGDEEEHILWCCRAAMLDQSQNRQLIKPLIKGLTYRDWFVRYRAASALGRLGDPKALPALMQLEQSDPEALVKDAATEAIDRIQQYNKN